MTLLVGCILNLVEFGCVGAEIVYVCGFVILWFYDFMVMWFHGFMILCLHFCFGDVVQYGI